MLNSSPGAEEGPYNPLSGPTHLLSERSHAGHLRHTDAQPHLQKRKGTLGKDVKSKGSFPWLILMCTQDQKLLKKSESLL